MQNRRLVLTVSVLILLFAIQTDPVFAQESGALTKGNQPLLCVPVDGARYVDPDSLYSTIVQLSGVPPTIIVNSLKKWTWREMVEDDNFPPADGAKPYQEMMEAIRKSKQKIKLNLIGEITNEYTAYFIRKEGYEIEKNTPLFEKYRLTNQLAGTDNIAIRCVEPKKESETVKSINAFVGKNLDRVRVRASLAELTLSTGAPGDEKITERKKALLGAKLAEFSYAKDYEKDTKNVTANGAAGYRVTDNITPFVSYELTNKNGDKEDIKVVSPGIQLTKLGQDSLPIPVEIRSNLFTALDLNHGAQRLALNATFEPGFSIGNNLLSFGGYTQPFDGPIAIKPSIRPLIEASHVFDAGTNEQFKNAENYFGVGAEAGIRFRVPDVPVLDSMLLSVDYRILRLLAGDDETYDFFDVSLTWSPKDIPYFGFSLSYKNGQNNFTFQEQDTFKASIGAKF